jgi:hypothetical protein
MIDLAKPLGIHEGIIFYGDHEQPDLIYYFPDEVSLAPQMSSNGNATNIYELFFQIFHEGDVAEGGIEDLRKSAGSILSLGVKCDVSEERMQKAIEHLKGVHVLPENIRISTPLWVDGSVNLLALDSITSNEQSFGPDAFVKSIVGSQKPSLMSTDLKSVFNVRLDRRGTALIASALNGGTGSVAGVLYDLKFPAIRPAVDLKIWADLGRCYESISHTLGVKAEFTYGVKFSLGAEFEWLTKKLEENGDLKIEILTQVEDAETKKAIDEMVNDFKESILRELFMPYVNPQTTNITNMESIVPVVGVSYKFKKENINHNKIIEVDYRERSTVIRTHNPQSHLWVLGKQIAENKDKYIQKIVFGDLWREQSLSIQIIHDFEHAENDLLSAEVLIWRKKEGVLEKVNEGRFSIPETADPLKNITFHKANLEEVKLAWLYDEDEPVGYYYQIRFLFSGKVKNISSPEEIVTPPVFSSNQDLVIYPDTYTFYKKIEVREGNISFDEFKTVDVRLNLKDNKGALVGTELISLTEANKNEIWTVRGKSKENLYVEVGKEYQYDDDRPAIRTEPIYLMDDEVIVNKPFLRSTFNIIPVIAGSSENISKILLEIIIQSPDLDEEVKQLIQIAGPDFNVGDINIKLHSDKDKLFYKAKAITKDARIVEISEGLILDNALIINLKKLQENAVTFVWKGVSPEAADLNFLRIELQAIDANGNKTELPKIEYKGDEVAIPILKTFEQDKTIEMRITKRFLSGNTEKGNWTKIESKEITIQPE